MFFIAFLLYFKNISYFCIAPTLIASMWCGEVWGTYTYKRRNCTLWFWRSKNLASSNRLSKTKQRERSMGCLYTALICLLGKGMLYISSAWGFQRCSFRQSGQCEGLYTVERATRPAPRFLCLYVLMKNWWEDWLKCDTKSNPLR